jgi:hypothetical protein
METLPRGAVVPHDEAPRMEVVAASSRGSERRRWQGERAREVRAG